MYKEFDRVEIQVDGVAIYKGEVQSVKGESVFVRRTNLDGSMPVIMEYNIHDPQLVSISLPASPQMIAEEKEDANPIPDAVTPETTEPIASNEEPAAEEPEIFPEAPIEEVKDEPIASNEEPA